MILKESVVILKDGINVALERTWESRRTGNYKYFSSGGTVFDCLDRKLSKRRVSTGWIYIDRIPSSTEPMYFEKIS